MSFNALVRDCSKAHQLRAGPGQAQPCRPQLNVSTPTNREHSFCCTCECWLTRQINVLVWEAGEAGVAEGKLLQAPKTNQGLQQDRQDGRTGRAVVGN